MVVFVLMSLALSIGISAQNKADEPMGDKAAIALIEELKGVVTRLSPDKNEAKLVIEKWDKRTDLAGQTKKEVIDLLFEDVKSIIKDSGTQYQIYSMFSFYKNVDIDENKPQAILIDSFSYTNLEDMMARIDSFIVQMQNDSTLKGYIITKGNKSARTAAEKEIRNYLKMRAFDMKNFVFLNVDGDKTAEIELWLVPPGAKPPTQEKSADQTQTENKPQAVLNAEFRFENCESLMAQFDSFSVSMQNDPNAMGYIILNGKQRTRTNTAQQIREYIKMRRLDFNRYMFLNGDGDSSVVIEFWLVPNGAEPPAPKKSVDETSEKFEMPTEPFVYTEKFSYAAFGCTTPLDVEGYIAILKQYPKSRGNIVIYERSQRVFRQKEKEILAQLTKRGIARKRLKTFFKLVDSEAPNEGIKLWILP